MYQSTTLRSELYPEIEPVRSGMLELDAIHRMYWEECGNPRGVPVVLCDARSRESVKTVLLALLRHLYAKATAAAQTQTPANA